MKNGLTKSIAMKDAEISRLTAENAALRADLARVTGERDAAVQRSTTNTTRWSKLTTSLEKERDAALAEVGRARRAMENLEALFLDMRTPRNGETDRQLRTRIEAVSGNIHSAIALFRDPSTTAISFLTPPAQQQACVLCNGVGKVNKYDDVCTAVDCPKCKPAQQQEKPAHPEGGSRG